MSALTGSWRDRSRLATRMTCQEVSEVVRDFQSGEPNRYDGSELEAHLSECAPCVTYLASMQRIIRVAKDAFLDSSDSLSAAVPEELVRAILDARRLVRFSQL